MQPSRIPTTGPTWRPSVVPTTIKPSLLPSEIPTLVPTFTPTVLPSQSPTATPTQKPSGVPSKAPTSVATIVTFPLTYGLSGVSASDINVQDTKSSAYLALVDTVKACLVTDSRTGSFNVTITSVTDNSRRLQGYLRLRTHKKNQLSGGVSIKFTVSFDVDKQQFLNADDGMSKMKNNFNANAASGVFDTTLQTNTPSDSPLADATGATSCVTGTPAIQLIQLMYPSMQPTFSCSPTVLPTVPPTTFKPTLRPTTVNPTPLPTTAAPTFMPTMKTMAPTLSIIPPGIVDVAVDSYTQVTMSLTATFDKPTVYAGYIYCAALTRGAVLASTSQVVLAATPVQYLA
eukprot:gene47563-biopygen38562